VAILMSSSLVLGLLETASFLMLLAIIAGVAAIGIGTMIFLLHLVVVVVVVVSDPLEASFFVMVS